MLNSGRGQLDPRMLSSTQKSPPSGRVGVPLIWVRKFADNAGSSLKILREAVLGDESQNKHD
jgi:hypothetical protein